MKFKLHILICLAVIAVVSQALAKMDVGQTVDQLKENSENSKANLDAYEKNLTTVNNNIGELTKTINNLRTQKQNLQKNSGNIEKNKTALQEMEKSLVQYRADEQKKLADEQKQIEEVQALLTKLQANKQARETNIAAYSDKLDEIKRERSGWGTEQTSLTEITQALDSKEKEAVAERDRWMKKRQSYQEQVDKWNKQTYAADRTYNEYRKMNK